MRIMLAALVALTVQDKVLFEEKFAGKLSDGWTWVREDPAGQKVEGGALLIKAQPGTIWYKTNTARNLCLRKSPAAGTAEEPVAAEVTVENKPESDAEQAGLLYYVDDANYIKLVREAIKGKVNIVMAKEQKGIPENMPPKEDAASPYRLRLVWSGAQISGYYKPGGSGDWIQIGQYPVPPGDGSFALAAHGAKTPDADRWAKFTDFRISKAAK